MTLTESTRTLLDIRYEKAAEDYLRSLPLEHFMESTPHATQRKISWDSLELLAELRPDVHVYNNHVRCVTDSRGFETHRNRSPLEIRVDASDGFIPLWAENVTLRYRFQERSIRRYFDDPDAAKTEILKLFGEALDAWGDAVPVRFKLDDNASDFELVLMQQADCDNSGCVLASTFFPDAGRHHFRMYPTLFEQSRKEQVETFVHEIGHIFGLRHFFANVSETDWPSRLFGEDNAFSIMN